MVVTVVSSISGINEDPRERSATIQTATNSIIKASLAPTPSKVGEVATVIRPQPGKDITASGAPLPAAATPPLPPLRPPPPAPRQKSHAAGTVHQLYLQAHP